jgi:hypothetical protein
MPAFAPLMALQNVARQVPPGGVAQQLPLLQVVRRGLARQVAQQNVAPQVPVLKGAS